jgi:hypothetical protein
MKLQTAGQDRQLVPWPNRRALPASRALLPRGRSGRLRRAIRQDRRCGERRRHSRRPPGPGRRSGRLVRVAPRFPLTLRAMFGTRQVSAPARGRSMLALLVLALLALACFPVLAQADSSEIEYRDAPPTVTGEKAPNDNGPSAGSSNAPPGGGGGGGTAGPGSSDGGSSGGGSSQNSGGISGTPGDGTGQQGSPGKNQSSAVGPGKATEGGATPVSSQDDGGSSPLVPILIAIAVLAAISLGAVMYRRRRGLSSGSSVSPEAG